MIGEGAESRVRGWSGRWDQVGGWGRRRVGGDEEAESGQQEAGRGGVDEARREREAEKLKKQERDGGTSPTFIGFAARGEGPPRIVTSSPESGAPIGPVPSCGLPAWAGNRFTSFPARPFQTANIFRSDPTT